MPLKIRLSAVRPPLDSQSTGVDVGLGKDVAVAVGEGGGGVAVNWAIIAGAGVDVAGAEVAVGLGRGVAVSGGAAHNPVRGAISAVREGLPRQAGSKPPENTRARTIQNDFN